MEMMLPLLNGNVRCGDRKITLDPKLDEGLANVCTPVVVGVA